MVYTTYFIWIYTDLNVQFLSMYVDLIMYSLIEVLKWGGGGLFFITT